MLTEATIVRAEDPLSTERIYMKRIILILLIVFFSNTQLQAFWGTITKGGYKISRITQHSKSLSDKEIINLSKLSDEISGTKKVGNILGKKNLPKKVLEDTYIRIAIYQNKISRDEAELFYKNLSKTEGFVTTLRKIIGNNPQGTVGHLNELRIANSAAENGFKVVGIGKKFNDGRKSSLTDIDILLHKNGKDILIEAKKYSSHTKIPIDKFKADLDTLNIYEKNILKNKSIKIFSFTQKPKDEKLLKQYQFWADKKGVQLIFGTPQEQIEQIKMLEKIL